MAEYEIRVRPDVDEYYSVEANSKEEALQKYAEGEAELVHKEYGDDLEPPKVRKV